MGVRQGAQRLVGRQLVRAASTVQPLPFHGNGLLCELVHSQLHFPIGALANRLAFQGLTKADIPLCKAQPRSVRHLHSARGELAAPRHGLAIAVDLKDLSAKSLLVVIIVVIAWFDIFAFSQIIDSFWLGWWLGW